MTTIAELLLRRAQDDGIALHEGDRSWTYREFVELCAARAAYLLERRKPGPFHIGVLLENRIDFPLWIGACALAGATSVGLNGTRRGPDLVRDIDHSDCQLVITEDKYIDELKTLDSDRFGNDRILNVDTLLHDGELAPSLGVEPPRVEVQPGDAAMLIFTSGSTSAPKACICSHGRLVSTANAVAAHFGHSRDTVSLVSMPWFHTAAIVQGWLPALSVGAATVIAKFSVSQFLPTVQKFGVTHFNYVGKPLAYLLTAPRSPDDPSTSLRMVMGNEAAPGDIEEFEARYDCTVVDGYGSTEGGVSFARTADTPSGSLGVAASDGIKILDPETLSECPRAEIDSNGMLLNSNQAIGELVNTKGAGGFEGYWNNSEAAERRVRHGILWTGDLAYRDTHGFFWFAGRDDNWIRVDGENIASTQIEDAISRHPDIALAGAYAVPDNTVGDRVMVALQLKPGATFVADAFDDFLHALDDFSSKWLPSFVRICDQIPTTATSKVLRRQLRTERWQTEDPVWWRPERSDKLELMTLLQAEAYENSFKPGALTAI
ncbi:long-chain-fatty-acid--CoA ligase [Rhodococcus cerastii]|uniref:long-chain-fatty-acid--CoA ligase n=1 Tax=Rhodococcus erythropolis group TaxID=2840174 RepID=UPI0037B0B7E7|nr:long-chain-fatty-acid--CoA ligase [Rhodococcus cerastii]